MSAADMIKGLRKRSNLTLNNLSYLLGVSQATLYNWESGKSKPSIVVLYGLKYMSENNLLIDKHSDIKF